MPDITYGSALEFESGITNWCQCAEIDTNKFVVVFCDVGDGNAGKARVATVSGTTITWGAVSEFCADVEGSFQLDVCKLDTDKFVVTYRDSTAGGSDRGYARVGTVVTRTIDSWGTAKLFESSHIYCPSCCQLGTDKFAIAYDDYNSGGTVCVCTVSTSTITSGTPVAFEGVIAGTDCCKLDTDKFVVTYEDDDDSDKAKGCVFTVSGTTPTTGTIKLIHDAFSSVTRCDQLDTDKFVAVWRGSGNDGFVVIGTVSDSIISLGTEVEFNTADIMTVDVAKIDATRFVIAYEDVGNSEKGTSILCEFSGDTITPGSEEVWHDATTGHVAACLISSGKIVVCYMDDADASDIGEAIIGDAAAAGVDITVEVTLATADSAGLAPTMSIGSTLLPPVATADAAGVVPEVRMSLAIQVPVGTIDAEALAAILSIGSTLLPPAGTVDVAGLAPTLSIGSTLLVPVATVTADGKAPTLSLGVTVTVPTATATAEALIIGIITEWIKLTLRVRSLAMTLKPRSIKLTLKPRSLAMTLPKKRK